MSKFKYLLIVSCFLCMHNIHAQNTTSLIIDSSEMQFSDVSLPYWLKAGQTVDLGPNAKKASIIEFTINNSNLDFSRVFSLVNKQTVPSNKVWKIEGIGLKKTDTSMYSSSAVVVGGSSSNTSLPSIFQSPVKFETPGTFTWKVPPGITKICIEAWGGGGGGGGTNGAQNGAGGGGGSFGYGCYTVIPGTLYTINVGGGGGSSITGGYSGGNSNVGNLIYANGGTGGSTGNNTNCIPASVGVGGISNGSFSNNGTAGTQALVCPSNGVGNGGNGGSCSNCGAGGLGGIQGATGGTGATPGGGGGGSWYSSGTGLRLGGPGGNGKVIIYF